MPEEFLWKLAFWAITGVMGAAAGLAVWIYRRDNSAQDADIRELWKAHEEHCKQASEDRQVLKQLEFAWKTMEPLLEKLSTGVFELKEIIGRFDTTQSGFKETIDGFSKRFEQHTEALMGVRERVARLEK